LAPSVRATIGIGDYEEDDGVQFVRLKFEKELNLQHQLRSTWEKPTEWEKPSESNCKELNLAKEALPNAADSSTHPNQVSIEFDNEIVNNKCLLLSWKQKRWSINHFLILLNYHSRK
jgi:hypothetical protein